MQKNGRRAKGGKEGLYEDTVSTYRIFSRAFCNYVFPRPTITRPMPREGEDIETAIEQTADEDLLDAIDQEEMLANPDGRYTPDDIPLQEELGIDKNYEQRIKTVLQLLKTNQDEFLSHGALETYSPKFLNILENIQDEDHRGLHLIYSQFRTLEGVGILKLILEANGFAQFKIKRQEGGEWVLDIPVEDRGKPTFALYTGTESPEEKEIIRNIFNSSWKYIPGSLVKQLEATSSNNFYGEIIKVLMITSSGAEGISLRNVRYVHITEPYWHPVRVQQVIGRARRICSHNDLPRELQTVEVFMYLMTFSPDQLDSDKSIELRLKDKSKIDNSTPLTSDEALYEISTLKEEISEKLLLGVKESAIDCSLHAKAGDKEALQCFTFGDVGTDKFAYKPSISDEDTDMVAAVNKTKITWKAKSIMIARKKYALKEGDIPGTGEIYDLESYKRKNPLLLGHLSKEGKKRKIDWL